MKFFIHISFLLILLSACTGSVKTPSPISGVVQLGRVKNAVVRVYALSVDGQRVEPALEETITNDDGEYFLKTSVNLQGPLLVVASGANGGETKYKDEITGSEISLSQTDELMAVVDGSSDGRVAVTPISSTVAEHVMWGIQDSGLESFSAIKSKAIYDASMMWGMNVDDMEAIPAHPEKMEGASLREMRAAFILFVFSQFLLDMEESSASPVPFVKGLAEDSLDGNLDGKNIRPRPKSNASLKTHSLATASAQVEKLSTNWTSGMATARRKVLAQFGFFGFLNKEKISSFSSIVDSVSAVTVPEAPTEVSASAVGGTEVTLNWTAPSDTGGSAITDYIIQYKQTNSESWTVFEDGIGNATTVTVTGLINGTSYDFRLTAVNAAGESGYSSAITVSDTTAPTLNSVAIDSGAIYSTAASPYVAALALSASDNVSVFEMKVSEGVADCSIGTWVSYAADSNINLTPNATNTVSVKVKDSAGNESGCVSDTIIHDGTLPVITADATTPISPTSPSSNTTPTANFTLSEGATVTLYNGSACTTAISASSLKESGAQTLVTNTLSEGAYNIYAKAVDAATNASSCTLISENYEIISVPGAPTGLLASALDESVSLTWTAPSSDGGSPIIGYKIEHQLASGGAWTVFSDNTSTATTLTVTGLTNNTSYVFRVAAKNGAGAGSYSESSSAVTPQPAFVSTWKTDNTSTGSSASNQITLPLESTGTYDFTVDWGDGTQNTITAWDDANATHTYDNPGTYTLTITGTITGFRFNNGGDKSKITNISKFGKLNLGNNGGYFYGAYNLTISATDTLDLTDTTNMSYAFAECYALGTAPSMANWDMSNVTNMEAMFYLAVEFNQPIGSWNVSSVSNMKNMFAYATKFDQAIGSWDVSSVTIMRSMFESAEAFNQPLGNWNTANVTDMYYMFGYASAFDQPIGNWNVSNVTNMSVMFGDADKFNQPIGNWNTSNVTDMSWMFTGADKFNQAIGNWNTAKVTDMSWMFTNTMVFNQSLDSWNVSNVTNMARMFENANAFNESIGSWNTANVTNMASMFSSATAFNQNIGNWNTSNVNFMNSMFSAATVFNQPIGNWNTSNVNFMNYMFSAATVFNQPIGNWNTSKVQETTRMFYNATSFNQPIGNWNVANVTDMVEMFALASSFNQPIGGWNVTNVTAAYKMFNQASSFNQNIGTWNVTSMLYLFGMFDSSGLTRTNYDPILLGWSAQNVKTGLLFHAGSAKYSQSAAVLAARAALTNAVPGGKGWTITDGGGEAVAPGAPTSVSGTAGNAEVSLSWTAPSDTGGSAITDYIVQYKLSSDSTWSTFSDATSTNTTATVTSLTNGSSYNFQVAAKNAAGTSTFTQTSSSITPAAPASCGGDCYTDAQSLAIGTERLGPDGATLALEYANGSSGFKIWREKSGNRILNATGLVANGWQQRLNRAGTATDGDFTSSTYIGQIEGRVCPGLTPGSGVFVNFDNMVDSTRCLYYDSGNEAQRVDAAGTSGTEASDWLQHWNRAATGRGTSSSYYEGNIKTCADKGMRLPTIYETSATTNPYSGTYYQPVGDGLTPTHPTWAGSTNGVPHHLNWTWTASAVTYGTSDYWSWVGASANFSSYDISTYVRCVLPSSSPLDINLYTNAETLAIDTEVPGPDGTTLTLQYANGTSGFKIWREKVASGNPSRILNSSGIASRGWQRMLNRSGVGWSSSNLLTTTTISGSATTVVSQIEGRVCPGLTPGSGVFVNFDNMVDSTRCLYYDSGNTAQTLDAAGTGGTEASDWLQYWSTAATGRGTSSSYFEGNIKTCADKGMRLPTVYETTMTYASWMASYLPTGDGISTPTWAGSTNGVPSHSGYTWTASAHTLIPDYYWPWSGTSSGYYYYYGSLSVRCVLP